MVGYSFSVMNNDNGNNLGTYEHNFSALDHVIQYYFLSIFVGFVCYKKNSLMTTLSLHRNQYAKKTYLNSPFDSMF